MPEISTNNTDSSILELINADIIVLTHFAFILFVIFGGFMVLKWQKLIWLHVPAAVWGALIELYGWICPLTTLENNLRRNRGEDYYSTGFIEHYIMPIIYPSGLTREIQIVLAVLVIIINAFAYTMLLLKYKNQAAK